MIKDPTAEARQDNSSKARRGSVSRQPLARLAALGVAAVVAITGCRTQMPQPGAFTQLVPDNSQSVVLREGDVLRISFPGTPNLNSPPQQIRADGRITLPLVGEVKAAGLTPAGLQKEILRLYADQLVSKEVTVEIESSSFPVFVTGAVIHPGKIQSNRQLTVLEAIMEAGGFDYVKANLKSVRIIRNEEGQMKSFTVNLDLVLKGKQTEPFYLKPSDIVFVPERFSWF